MSSTDDVISCCTSVYHDLTEMYYFESMLILLLPGYSAFLPRRTHSQLPEESLYHEPYTCGDDYQYVRESDFDSSEYNSLRKTFKVCVFSWKHLCHI